jgi:hypothetical protein
MQVIYDNIFNYSPRVHVNAACHLKVIIGNSRVLMIATEVQENLGWSIARSPEVLATQAINLFQLNPDITKYIEHYHPREKSPWIHENALVRPIEAYFLVDFKWETTNDSPSLYKASKPQRKALSVIDFVRMMRTFYTQK